MNDVELLDLLTSADPLAPEIELPEGSVPSDIVLREIERRYHMPGMTDMDKSIQLPTRPSRRWLVAAGAFVIVLLIGIGYWALAPGDGADLDVAAAIDASLLEAAQAGDPLAIAEVWWLAAWTGQPDIFVPLTDPNIVSAGTLTELVGQSEFHAALNPGTNPFEIQVCEEAVGFPGRYRCTFITPAESAGYVWKAGEENTYTIEIQESLVTSVSYRWAFIDDAAIAPIVSAAESADPAGFATNCETNPGGDWVAQDNDRRPSKTDVPFTPFVVNGTCGAFLQPFAGN